VFDNKNSTIIDGNFVFPEKSLIYNLRWYLYRNTNLYGYYCRTGKNQTLYKN
jgi:hypothetical protein